MQDKPKNKKKLKLEKAFAKKISKRCKEKNVKKRKQCMANN